MTLIYYDMQMPRDELQGLAQKIRESIDDEILFLPKSFDVYLDVSEEQLLSVKNTIESALALKKVN